MTTEELTQINYNTSFLFKALIRETTVYNYYVELKDDVLTEDGYFDLVRVPDLRVAGTGQFIKKLRLEKSLSQSKFAKLFEITRSKLNHWERDNRTIPLRLLVKMAETGGISKAKIYSLIDQGKFKTKNALPVRIEKIHDIINYFSPHKSKYGANWEITVIQCADEILSKINSLLHVNIKSYPYGKRIKSKELYTFLTTFFHYPEVPKITPPLTEEVKLWHEKGVDLKRAVIIPCLQSDGAIGYTPPNLRFYGESKILHNYVVDAMYYEYNELPSSYLWKENESEDCYTTAYQKKSMKGIIAEVMKLAGNTKTSPAKGQTVEEYLIEPQPHLNYLMNAPATEQGIALRIWAATEGSITITASGGYTKPKLEIGCAHPDLMMQLKQLGKRFNIRFTTIRTKDSWSGFMVLQSTGLRSVLNFLKLGGFINGVEISSSSPYHEDIAKDVYLLGILEFNTRERENSQLRNLSRANIHQAINKIINNKEYHTADYYINYFS